MKTLTTTAQNVRTVSLQPSKKAGLRSAAIIPGLGNVVNGFVDVGSSNTRELILTITGLNLTTDVPATVVCQPRQFANQDFNFPDIFGVQVVTTSVTEIVLRIMRLDGDGGWGQDLRLDFLILDSAHNP